MKKLKLLSVFLLVIAFLTGMKKTGLKSPLSADTIIHSNGNPIITHPYTADPAAMVYNGKVYLYTGHDEAPAKVSSYRMHNWLCFLLNPLNG